jgi:hypothetical protein
MPEYPIANLFALALISYCQSARVPGYPAARVLECLNILLPVFSRAWITCCQCARLPEYPAASLLVFACIYYCLSARVP